MEMYLSLVAYKCYRFPPHIKKSQETTFKITIFSHLCTIPSTPSSRITMRMANSLGAMVQRGWFACGSKSRPNNVTIGTTCLWHWRSKSPLLDWGSAVGTAAAVASVYNIVNRLLTSWSRGMLGIRLLLLLSSLLSISLSIPLSPPLFLLLYNTMLVRSTHLW